MLLQKGTGQLTHSDDAVWDIFWGPLLLTGFNINPNMDK